ncbi:uncharacterized protein LOC117173779 [Belonocnema kinseyi]|uniref:uncharacterized protein LOC117173779 n=1 Tax=Belonocnema kinseyi TaxID=2817044 RepID=UPI00143CFC97|nr:uncharacterized protein LOC117173779 [Belonocnema kinseyi]
MKTCIDILILIFVVGLNFKSGALQQHNSLHGQPYENFSPSPFSIGVLRPPLHALYPKIQPNHVSPQVEPRNRQNAEPGYVFDTTRHQAVHPRTHLKRSQLIGVINPSQIQPRRPKPKPVIVQQPDGSFSTAIPVPFGARFNKRKMCLFYDSFLSRMTPRYLVCSSISNFCSDNLKELVVSQLNLLVKTTASALLGLTDSPVLTIITITSISSA